jgi:hypothetical protein
MLPEMEIDFGTTRRSRHGVDGLVRAGTRLYPTPQARRFLGQHFIARRSRSRAGEGGDDA